MEALIMFGNFEFRFDDEDVVNLDDWIPRGESNPHNVRPWLLHDHGFTQCVVFADCEQDALDIAADSGKIDHFKVSQDEMKDYPDDKHGNPDGRLCFLGNAGEPFDSESIEILELPNPKRSFVAQFNARQS
jgi:hypothetical protein